MRTLLALPLLLLALGPACLAAAEPSAARESPQELLARAMAVQPPDVALVETYEIERGPASLRRMILTAAGGWGEREGARQALPADLVAHEREQFYLYYLMRLAPLRSPTFDLAALPSSSTGESGLRVKAQGRPEVDLFFDPAGTLTRLRTRLRKPGSAAEVLRSVRSCRRGPRPAATSRARRPWLRRSLGR
jgi:hypothetical protein